MTANEELIKNGVLKELWGLILLRGISMVILGIILLAFPMASLTVLLALMGAWWIIDGVITVFKSFKGREYQKAWGWGIFMGVLGIVAGVVVLSKPLASAILTTSFLTWFLGIVALAYGLNGIVTGISLRKEIRGEWSMILGGILSICFGIILMVSPFVSAVIILKTVGIVASVVGIVVIIVAFGVKKRAAKLSEN
jgi:uncharacterized membrane protein HdeD (DUF308 family)